MPHVLVNPLQVGHYPRRKRWHPLAHALPHHDALRVGTPLPFVIVHAVGLLRKSHDGGRLPPRRPSRWGTPPRRLRTEYPPQCDGRAPGPHTRGTSSLPVKRGHVDSRQGRSDPVSPKRPPALAREICPTDAYIESFRWRSTCDRPVTHQPQPRSRDFPGTSKSPGRPPVKGLILCKPDLDH